MSIKKRYKKSARRKQALITTPKLKAFSQKMADQIQWEPMLIKKVHAFTLVPFFSKLPNYAKQSQNYFSDYSAAEYLYAMPTYGDLSSTNHMFAHKALDWGFSFSEPMLTKGLVHFFTHSPLASWYFLNALFDCDESDIGNTQLPDKVTFLHSTTVRAEVITSENKRIDVVIRWRSAQGVPCLAVLECKFGHHIGKGQLPSYQNYVKAQAGSDHYLFLVFSRLNNKSQKIMCNHHNRKVWRQVKWERLLQRWEYYLSHSDELIDLEDFARFRHTLWQKALQHSV